MRRMLYLVAWLHGLVEQWCLQSAAKARSTPDRTDYKIFQTEWRRVLNCQCIDKPKDMIVVVEKTSYGTSKKVDVAETPYSYYHQAEDRTSREEEEEERTTTQQQQQQHYDSCH
jgi:hypothetical protein